MLKWLKKIIGRKNSSVEQHSHNYIIETWEDGCAVERDKDGIVICPDCGEIMFEEIEEDEIPLPIVKERIGRNAPCPCGSGKKYKRCCGR
ncbi:SEC-C domain-containing protein [Candidatus Pacearchaeota archaeon]|nr:SEC-C domain-containing protein [Candidatus Pacearchaeota archaeon]